MKESPATEQSTWLDEHPKAKWLATSRTTGYASIAVVALVVVLVVVVLIVNRGRSDDPAAAPSAPSTTAVAPQPDNTGVTGFDPSIADPFGREISVPLDKQGQVLAQTDPGERSTFTPGTPVAAPEGMKWQRIGATVAPFSTSDGPTSIDGRLAFGFAHTPQGAALAGFHIDARALRSGDDLREIYDRQYVADPGLIERQLTYLEASGEADYRTGRALVFPEAFKVMSYNEGFAVVQYATPLGGGRWNVGQNALVWSGGDWKIRLTDVQPRLPQISTLNGWTQW